MHASLAHANRNFHHPQARRSEVVDISAINRFVAEHNTEPKLFTWTADPDKIIRAVRRGHQV